MGNFRNYFRFWWQNLIYDPRHTPKEIHKRVVAIGGGTGLSTLLRGLRNYCENITAIVTMTDNGASSGRLKKEFNILPPGDIRKCLLALSKEEVLLNRLFGYRFKSQKGGELDGHSFGNLFLTALADLAGSFEGGIELAGHLLNVSGEVLPAILEPVELAAKLKDGRIVVGEYEIVESGVLLKKNNLLDSLHLSRQAKANPRALEAISKAEIIIIGPGSLYTSIIPNFLIPGIRKAVARSSAKKLYILNASTEKGETEGLSGEEHLKILLYYLKSNVDYVLSLSHPLIEEREGILGNVKNITIPKDKILGIKVVHADVLDKERPLYHHPEKLAQTIIQLVR